MCEASHWEVPNIRGAAAEHCKGELTNHLLVPTAVKDLLRRLTRVRQATCGARYEQSAPPQIVNMLNTGAMCE